MIRQLCVILLFVLLSGQLLLAGNQPAESVNRSLQGSDITKQVQKKEPLVEKETPPATKQEDDPKQEESSSFDDEHG